MSTETLQQAEPGLLSHGTSDSRGIDVLLSGSLFVLASIGVAMFNSAMQWTALRSSAPHVPLRHYATLMIGAVCFYIFGKVDYQRIRAFATTSLALCCALLIYSNVADLLRLPTFPTITARFAEFALALAIPAKLNQLQPSERTPERVWNTYSWVGLIVFLVVMLNPSSALMCLLIGLCSAFLFLPDGVKLVCYALAPSTMMFYMLVFRVPWRYMRIFAFLDPERDPQGRGFELLQALAAIGSGGLTGEGYGASIQKHGFLPRPYGNAITAVIAEELGFLGIATIVLLFAVMLWRVYVAFLSSHDELGQMLAASIGCWLAIRVTTNLCQQSGMLLGGASLPLFSFDPAVNILTFAALGIIANISRGNTPRYLYQAHARVGLWAKALAAPGRVLFDQSVRYGRRIERNIIFRLLLSAIAILGFVLTIVSLWLQTKG